MGNNQGNFKGSGHQLGGEATAGEQRPRHTTTRVQQPDQDEKRRRALEAIERRKRENSHLKLKGSKKKASKATAVKNAESSTSDSSASSSRVATSNVKPPTPTTHDQRDVSQMTEDEQLAYALSLSEAGASTTAANGGRDSTADQEERRRIMAAAADKRRKEAKTHLRVKKKYNTRSEPTGTTVETTNQSSSASGEWDPTKAHFSSGASGRAAVILND
eukprot:INCI4051.4.p1 GENE.INCI4051.4~~INCI4051.4.p1  ORF type:complete len:218 (+),score=37.39 INCI4051.4:239-892(+)